MSLRDFSSTRYRSTITVAAIVVVITGLGIVVANATPDQSFKAGTAMAFDKKSDQTKAQTPGFEDRVANGYKALGAGDATAAGQNLVLGETEAQTAENERQQAREKLDAIGAGDAAPEVVDAQRDLDRAERAHQERSRGDADHGGRGDSGGGHDPTHTDGGKDYSNVS